jgi:hypothetical protein
VVHYPGAEESGGGVPVADAGIDVAIQVALVDRLRAYFLIKLYTCEEGNPPWINGT